MITVALPAAKAGLFTVCPSLETTSVLLEAQVMVEPLLPDDGKEFNAKVIFDKSGFAP